MTWVDRFGVFVSKSCENAIIKKRVEGKNGVIFGEGREVQAITIVSSTIITHHVSHIPKHSIPHPLFLFYFKEPIILPLRQMPSILPISLQTLPSPSHPFI